MYFYNYKNNKRTNSKFNKVFATRRHFDVKFGTVSFFVFLTSLAIFGKIERFSSRLSQFPTENSRFSRLRQRRTQDSAKEGGTTEGVGAKQAKGVGSHIKKHSF